MKLSSITYAISYGKSRESLVISEGARRVKLAEKYAFNRKKYKNSMFALMYGRSL